MYDLVVSQDTYDLSVSGYQYDLALETSINVTGGGGPSLQEKSVDPLESVQRVEPDEGYDGLSAVLISAVSSSYVGSGITRRSSSDLTASGATVTAQAGYYSSNVTKTLPNADAGVVVVEHEFYTENSQRKWHYKPRLEVDSAGWVPLQDQDGEYWVYNAVPSNTTITPTTSTQTVGGAKYMMEGAVTVAAMPTGTAGTPTATKGTLSNHSISVTPSVTNSTGYITGGTKTGTAVSVSASELVSGSETKTANGTYDVTNLAELVVNVSSGTSVKTASGTFSGDGSRDISFTCNFEPDVIYWTSDPGTSSSTGVVAGIIVRGMMAAARYRNNSTSNSHYAMIDITGMNTAGSSYSFRATYSNSTVTLYSFSSNARTYFVNGRTYSWQAVKYTT